MDIESLYNFCLEIKGAEASTPFDDVTLVFKVCGKIFALIPLDAPEPAIALKCDPELAVELRDRYNCVIPAFHMNKTHWNTIMLTGEMPDSELKEWINHSVGEVIKKLPKYKQKEYLQ